jgi:twitching motility protein PilI
MVGNSDFETGSGPDQDPEFQELETPEGELHLRFYIQSNNEFAIPATGIKEVIAQSPETITPIPNVSPLLLGTLNVRGRIVWVADLGQFLGDAHPLKMDRSEISVIAVEDQDTILGLAVEGIVGMAWLDLEQLQAPQSAPDSMAPFVKGEWTMGSEEAPHQIRLLDQVTILRSARWAA